MSNEGLIKKLWYALFGRPEQWETVAVRTVQINWTKPDENGVAKETGISDKITYICQESDRGNRRVNWEASSTLLRKNSHPYYHEVILPWLHDQEVEEKTPPKPKGKKGNVVEVDFDKR